MQVDGNMEQVTISVTPTEAADLWRWVERATHREDGLPGVVAQLRNKLSPYAELEQLRAALSRSRADVLRLEQQQRQLIASLQPPARPEAGGCL